MSLRHAALIAMVLSGCAAPSVDFDTARAARVEELEQRTDLAVRREREAQARIRRLEREVAALRAEAGSSDPAPTLIRDATSALLHGAIPRAAALYREATEASPRNAAAWRGLGVSSERLAWLPEARDAYARYLELAPDARDAATVRERLARLAR